MNELKRKEKNKYIQKKRKERTNERRKEGKKKKKERKEERKKNGTASLPLFSGASTRGGCLVVGLCHGHNIAQGVLDPTPGVTHWFFSSGRGWLGLAESVHLVLKACGFFGGVLGPNLLI